MIEVLVELLVAVEFIALMMGLFGQFSWEVRARRFGFAGWFLGLLSITALISLEVGAWALLFSYVALPLFVSLSSLVARWQPRQPRQPRPEWDTWKVPDA